MRQQHIHVRGGIDASGPPSIDELDVGEDDSTLTSDGRVLPTKTSSIHLIRGRLGRKIWPVTLEDAETGECITIEIKQLRPGETALLSQDKLPVLRSEFPDFTAHVDALPLPPDAQPGGGEFWQKVSKITSNLGNPDEDTSVWEAVQFTHRYQAEVVAEAVVDKQIDLDLILGFPRAFLQTLYEVATGSLAKTTVDTFSDVGEEAGESE